MKTDPGDVPNSVVYDSSMFENPFSRSLGQTFIKISIKTRIGTFY